MIELRETEVDVLIGNGLLDSEMRHDPRAVCAALYTHLDKTLGSVAWRQHQTLGPVRDAKPQVTRDAKQQALRVTRW
jgi:hypothetical protein